MSDAAPAFEDYFADYATAFNDRDAERIAAFFHCPCLLVNGDLVAHLDDPRVIRSRMEALLDHHRDEDVGRVAVAGLEPCSRYLMHS